MDDLERAQWLKSLQVGDVVWTACYMSGSKAEQQTISETTRSRIILCDDEGNLTYWNRRDGFEGLSPEEAEEEGASEWYALKRIMPREHIDGLIERSSRKEAEYELERRMDNPDGLPRPKYLNA